MNIFIEKINSKNLIITGQDFDHLKVRRQKQGQFFKIVETQGDSYCEAELVNFGKKEAEFKVKQIFKKKTKKTQIVLYQAIIKKSNMELIVQKATELGVDRIIPVVTERVSEQGTLNMTRLAVIARESAMQSERLDIPEVLEPINFLDAVKADNFFCLGERTTGKNIKDLMLMLPPCPNIAVFIGPEGGFSEKEVSILQANYVPIVSFGESIMRSETSAIAVLSVIRCFCLAE